MLSESNNKRIHFIDNARAIASLGGFLTHVGMIFSTPYIINIDETNYSQILKYISNDLNYYRMPLFLFAAGFFTIYGIKKYSGIKFILHRAQRILFPFVISCLIILPFQAFFYTKYEYGIHWKNFFLKNVSPLTSPFGLSHLWFLYHIFIYSIVMVFSYHFYKYFKLKNTLLLKINKLNDSLFGFMVFWLILSLVLYNIGFQLNKIKNLFFLVFDIRRAGLEFPIFLFGCYAYINRDILSKHINGNIYKIIIPGLLYIGILLTTKVLVFNPIFKQYLVIFIRWAMFLTVINLIKLFLDYNNKILSYLAKASYPIYLFHHPIILAFAYYYVKNPLFNSAIAGFFLLLILSLITTYGFYELMVNRNKLGAFLFTGAPLHKNNRKPSKKFVMNSKYVLDVTN